MDKVLLRLSFSSATRFFLLFILIKLISIVLLIHSHMFTFQVLISKIAGPEVMLVFAIVFAIFLYKKNDTKDFYILLFTSTTAMFFTYTIKHWLKIPRPAGMLILEDGYRFPSGHATMAAVVMSLGIYYTHRYIHDKYTRYFLYLSAATWYVLVSYSRIYLKVHLPIDVLAGGIIGAVSTIVVVKIFKHLHYYK